MCWLSHFTPILIVFFATDLNIILHRFSPSTQPATDFSSNLILHIRVKKKMRMIHPSYLHKSADNMTDFSINFLTGTWFLELIRFFTDAGEKSQRCKETLASYNCSLQMCSKVGSVLIQYIYTNPYIHFLLLSLTPFVSSQENSNKKSQK